MQMKRRGVEPRLVIEGHDRRVRPDPALLKAVARAHRWFHDLASGGRAASLADIAVRAGVTGRYVRRLLRLAFLAPSIVETIMQGRQPAQLTAQRVLTRTVLLIGVARAEKRTSQNNVLLIFDNYRQRSR
jgi:site-specific DNA recombinase